MLDYSALSTVAAIVREGSFERAAAVLGITPSAVSQRVRALEERIGGIVIVRDQPCRATALGVQLCAHVDQVRLMEESVLAALPSRADEERVPLTIRVAVNGDSLATWFPVAAAAFAAETGILLDLILDDEAHTADRLRSGEVLAAVTADPEAVQGCRTHSLGALRYTACAAPDFVTRHFPDRVDAAGLARAPVLRFDRRDSLQGLWAKQVLGIDLNAPTHWVPSTRGFLDMALAGLGWGMQPVTLAEEALEAGALVELVPGAWLDVQLYWQVSRLEAAALHSLTRAVRNRTATLLV